MAMEKLAARLEGAEQEAETAREYLVNEQRLNASMAKKVEELQERVTKLKT